MFVLKTLTLFICAVISFNDAKFVDTINKCSIKDSACQGNVVTSVLKTIDKSGIPELGIPPTDPFEFKTIVVPVMDLIEVTFTDGTLKGLKNCVVEDFNTDIEKGHSDMTLLCSSLSVKTKYKVSGSSPLLKNLFGGESIRGEGNGKVKIEKVKLKMDYLYDVARNKDGDTFFKCKFDKTIYTFEVLGKAIFAADNVFLGDKDASQLVVGYMNANSKFVINTFGKIFMDKAMELVYDYTHNFFNSVPAKYFILEDLSEYVKS